MENWLYIRPSEPKNYDYIAHFIDVGQGDAVLLKFSSGKTMLVDSGTKENITKFKKYLDRYLFKDKKKIDYVVLTHPDVDHSGNMEYIIDHYSIGTFYRPACLSKYEAAQDGIDNNTFSSIIRKLNEKNISTIINSAGLELDVDGINIKWLAPLDDAYIDTNLYSPVLIIDNDIKKLMLTGDIDSNIESRLISTYNANELDIDILKVAHHGSKNSTSSDFIEATSPTVALISVGNNTYSQPANEVYNRILQYDKDNNCTLFNSTYSTLDYGNIIIAVDSDIHFSNIPDILVYSFYGYWLYELIALLVLLIALLKPYIAVGIKNLKYVLRNRKFERMQGKDKNN